MEVSQRLAILWKRKWVILATTLIAGLAAWLAIPLFAPAPINPPSAFAVLDTPTSTVKLYSPTVVIEEIPTVESTVVPVLSPEPTSTVQPTQPTSTVQSPEPTSTVLPPTQTPAAQNDLVNLRFDNPSDLDNWLSTSKAYGGFGPSWGPYPDRYMGGFPGAPVIAKNPDGLDSLKFTLTPINQQHPVSPQVTQMIKDSNGVYYQTTAISFPLITSASRITVNYRLYPPHSDRIGNSWGGVWLVPDRPALTKMGVLPSELKRLKAQGLELDLSEFVANYNSNLGNTVFMAVDHNHTLTSNPSFITSLDQFDTILKDPRRLALPTAKRSYTAGEPIEVQGVIDFQSGSLQVFINGVEFFFQKGGPNTPSLQVQTSNGLKNAPLDLIFSLSAGSRAGGWPGPATISSNSGPSPEGTMFVDYLKITEDVDKAVPAP